MRGSGTPVPDKKGVLMKSFYWLVRFFYVLSKYGIFYDLCLVMVSVRFLR